MPKKIRVLIAKPGLDGHDRGAKVIARALRDAGMEVIYPGRRQPPEDIGEAAIQEDVDAIGLSCLSGAHMALFPDVVKLLRKRKAGDIVVAAGGIIPEEDVPPLKKAGGKGVFGPGQPPLPSPPPRGRPTSSGSRARRAWGRAPSSAASSANSGSAGSGWASSPSIRRPPTRVGRASATGSGGRSRGRVPGSCAAPW